jgi:hypothetical protein
MALSEEQTDFFCAGLDSIIHSKKPVTVRKVVPLGRKCCGVSTGRNITLTRRQHHENQRRIPSGYA